MDETEKYIKVHDFLRNDLLLTDMMTRVFSLIFTMETRNAHPVGQAFISEKCRISRREVKQMVKCLMGIGILRKVCIRPNGITTYGPAISNCRSTSEAKNQLVNAVHRCTSFTGAREASPRCARCTFGGAYHAPYITDINIEKKGIIMEKELKDMELMARNWLKRMDQNSTDRTPSKLAGFMSCATLQSASEILTASYAGTMKRRGVTSPLDDATRTRLAKIAKWLVKHECPGLLLYGQCGIGKTTMLKALREMLSIGRGFGQVVYVTASEINGLMMDDAMRDKYEQLKSVPVLLIDDIGCEPVKCVIYGTACEPIRDLLYARYDRLLVTICTTNLDDAQIKGRYGERIADRIEESFDKLTFTGTSYRKRPMNP